ncbi:PACE efflux transporter [Ferrimonas senticii]|uniref:PACE efflux transporter n=1 Tax=Ferrimonas senticii TaxID=394566 RepID=UPI00041D3023|nr:PACE efflux transporter [Ferrimonas senticii]
MSTFERIFHATLFELLAIALSVIGLMLFTDHPVTALSGTMVLIATIAMIWNFVFNWGFDQLVPGDRVNRNLATRIAHVLLFESGLLLITVPVMAYMLQVGWLEALLMDIGVTVLITIYAFFYNLAYDHIRAAIVRRRQPATA